LPIDAEPLRKVLELEMEKGCQDSAVIGGLDGFLRRWVGQAAGSLATPRLLSRFRRLGLAKSDYSSLSQPQREKWIGEILQFLAEAAGEDSLSTARSPVSRVSARPWRPGSRSWG